MVEKRKKMTSAAAPPATITPNTRSQNRPPSEPSSSYVISLLSSPCRRLHRLRRRRTRRSRLRAHRAVLVRAADPSLHRSQLRRLHGHAEIVPPTVPASVTPSG